MIDNIKFLLLIVVLFSNNMTLANQSITIDELIGRFDQREHPDFIALDSTMLPVNKPNMYLRKKVAQKLIQAYQHFKRDHPSLPFIIVSATRNYDYQQAIWQTKWKNLASQYQNEQKIIDEILHYSAIPGTSRHHWGTDIDLNSLEPNYFLHNPIGKIVFAWFNRNMPKYGFCRPYTEGRDKGYQTEQWHWSYRPLAKRYQAQYRYYLNHQPDRIMRKLTVSDYNIKNIKALIEEYVFSISATCY